MSRLVIFDGHNTETILDRNIKTNILKKIGITFGLFKDNPLRFGELFVTHDIITLTDEHPEFLKEHYHSDVEARLFLEGGGCFFIHIGKVYGICMEPGDFIIIPAGLQHWFRLGHCMYAKVFRGFNIDQGWVAHYTGSDLAQKYSLDD